MFDAVLLDENMPGLNGLETLNEIKSIFPNLPVIMITKNEEKRQIMEEAIGAKISDYLIKPVNPSQILLALKNNVSTQKFNSRKKRSIITNKSFEKITLELNEFATLRRNGRISI